MTLWRIFCSFRRWHLITLLYVHFSVREVKKKEVKLSLLQAVEAHRVLKVQVSHIF
jgi:hypothetical protein